MNPVNSSQRPSRPRPSTKTRRRLLVALSSLLAPVALAAAWFWFSTPPGLEVVDINPPPSSQTSAAISTSLPPSTSIPTFGPPSTTSPAPTSTTAPTTPSQPSLEFPETTAVLLVGTDSRRGLDRDRYGDFGGARADVIVLAVAGPGVNPYLISFPRDLVVTDPCTGDQRRINATFASCGSWTSHARLVAAVSRATGLEVDHLVSVDMAGFIDLTDRLGGYPVTLPAPLRDPDALLDLPAGTQVLSGTQTLALLRSRKTQAFQNGAWRSVPGGDLSRAARQRDFVRFAGTALLADRSPDTLLSHYQAFSPYVTISDGLTTSTIVSLARTLPSPAEFGSVAPPTRPGRLGQASVLFASQPLGPWLHSLLIP